MQIGVSKYGGNISKIEIEIGNFEKAKCKWGTTFNQIFLTFFWTIHILKKYAYNWKKIRKSYFSKIKAHQT